MFYSRRVNTKTQQVEVWECKWLHRHFTMPEKCFIRKVGDEEGFDFSHERYNIGAAICWSPNQTIGNVALNYEEICGVVATQSGDDILTCQIIPAGKFRHGAQRWYCKIHQTYWGTKADYAAARNLGHRLVESSEINTSAEACDGIRAKIEPEIGPISITETEAYANINAKALTDSGTNPKPIAGTESGEACCHQQQTKMSYVINPLELVFSHYDEIKVSCLFPPALSSEKIPRRPARIEIYKRYSGQHAKVVERIVDALIFSFPERNDLPGHLPVSSIQVTPPAAFEFVRSLVEDREVSCVSCKKCGYPHLDLGSFAIKAHRKHFCGNCGNDNIWTKAKIISTPIKAFYDQYNNSDCCTLNDKKLSLDDYKGYKFKVWASIPALVWTSTKSQSVGIRIHVYDGHKTIIDDVFSTVVLQGVALDRQEIWALTLTKLIC